VEGKQTPDWFGPRGYFVITVSTADGYYADVSVRMQEGLGQDDAQSAVMNAAADALLTVMRKRQESEGT
jgi:hypothetical protein